MNDAASNQMLLEAFGSGEIVMLRKANAAQRDHINQLERDLETSRALIETMNKIVEIKNTMIRDLVSVARSVQKLTLDGHSLENDERVNTILANVEKLSV